MRTPTQAVKIIHDMLKQQIEDVEDTMPWNVQVHPPVVNTFTLVIEGEFFLVNVKKVSK